MFLNKMKAKEAVIERLKRKRGSKIFAYTSRDLEIS